VLEQERSIAAVERRSVVGLQELDNLAVQLGLELEVKVLGTKGLRRQSVVEQMVLGMKVARQLVVLVGKVLGTKEFRWQ